MAKLIHSNWLKLVSEGELVLVTDRIYGERLSTIEKLTKTQIVIKSGERFYKDSGSLVGGGSWSTTRISEPSLEDKKRISRQMQVRKIKNAFSNTDFSEWTISELNELEKILSEKGISNET